MDRCKWAIVLQQTNKVKDRKYAFTAIDAEEAVDKAPYTFMTKSPEEIGKRRTRPQNDEGFIYNKMIIFYEVEKTSFPSQYKNKILTYVSIL